jgi:hypothetical protein
MLQQIIEKSKEPEIIKVFFEDKETQLTESLCYPILILF